MIRNYLITAWRNIKHFKTYSTINMIGLIIGLFVFLILGFYVLNDLTYDRFHHNSEHIYRMITDNIENTVKLATWSVTVGPLVVALKNELPEVEASTRLMSRRLNIRVKSTSNEEETNTVRAYSLVADPGFFDVFSFRIVSGTASILQDPLVDRPAGLRNHTRRAEAEFR